MLIDDKQLVQISMLGHYSRNLNIYSFDLTLFSRKLHGFKKYSFWEKNIIISLIIYIYILNKEDFTCF